MGNTMENLHSMFKLAKHSASIIYGVKKNRAASTKVTTNKFGLTFRMGAFNTHTSYKFYWADGTFRCHYEIHTRWIRVFVVNIYFWLFPMFSFWYKFKSTNHHEKMLLKVIQSVRCVSRAMPLCQLSNVTTKPVHTIIKRNASIHTRNILIQKAKLEHVDNFGIILLVSYSFQTDPEIYGFQKIHGISCWLIDFQFYYNQLFPITSFGLGVWQIKRKIWKERLVAELKEKTSKEPVDIPEEYVTKLLRNQMKSTRWIKIN